MQLCARENQAKKIFKRKIEHISPTVQWGLVRYFKHWKSLMVKSSCTDLHLKIENQYDCHGEHVIEKGQKSNIHNIMSVYSGSEKLFSMSSNMLNSTWASRGLHPPGPLNT